MTGLSVLFKILQILLTSRNLKLPTPLQKMGSLGRATFSQNLDFNSLSFAYSKTGFNSIII